MEEVLPWFSSIMAGEGDWQKTLKEVKVPENVSFSPNGVFETKAYSDAGHKGGVALYMFHDGLSENLVKEAIAILQDGMALKKLVILPCDTQKKNASEWVDFYKNTYPADSRQAIAIGKAGESVYKCIDLFSALYCENADLGTSVTADKNIFYYIGQCDEGPGYGSANALYKSCKENEAEFEYRCRNHLDDARTDLLTGIAYMKSNLHNI